MSKLPSSGSRNREYYLTGFDRDRRETVMHKPKPTMPGDQIVTTMIKLARCPNLHRIILSGPARMFKLHRRGYSQVATTATCGLPRGQYDVALVEWQLHTRTPRGSGTSMFFFIGDAATPARNAKLLSCVGGTHGWVAEDPRALPRPLPPPSGAGAPQHGEPRNPPMRGKTSLQTRVTSHEAKLHQAADRPAHMNGINVDAVR